MAHSASWRHLMTKEARMSWSMNVPTLLVKLPADVGTSRRGSSTSSTQARCSFRAALKLDDR